MSAGVCAERAVVGPAASETPAGDAESELMVAGGGDTRGRGGEAVRDQQVHMLCLRSVTSMDALHSTWDCAQSYVTVLMS